MSKRDRAGMESDGLPSDEIYAIVRDIRAMPGTVKERTIAAGKKYPEFSERYPFLFDMVCAEYFDEGRFKYMMDMKTAIDNGKMNTEQASRKVGQSLYNDYVADKVPQKK